MHPKVMGKNIWGNRLRFHHRNKNKKFINNINNTKIQV